MSDVVSYITLKELYFIHLMHGIKFDLVFLFTLCSAFVIAVLYVYGK